MLPDWDNAKFWFWLFFTAVFLIAGIVQLIGAGFWGWIGLAAVAWYFWPQQYKSPD